MEDKELDTFIFRGEWLEKISALPKEEQAKIVMDIAKFGVGQEPMFSDDPVVVSMVNLVKDNISYTKREYLKKINMSKTAGRKKQYDDKDIYNLSRSGMSVAEMAIQLGCSESTIRHSEGYRNRKNADFEF